MFSNYLKLLAYGALIYGIWDSRSFAVSAATFGIACILGSIVLVNEDGFEVRRL